MEALLPEFVEAAVALAVALPALLHDAPEVVMAHGAVRKLLGEIGPRKAG